MGRPTLERRVWELFAAIGDEDAACTVAVCGHADEIGLMVNHITDDGFLYCVQIGGIDPATVVGNRVGFQSTVDGVDETVLGFVGDDRGASAGQGRRCQGAQVA